MTPGTSLRRTDVHVAVGILTGVAVAAVLVSTTKGAGMSPASFVPTPTSEARVGCGSSVAWFARSTHQPFIGTPAQLRRRVSLATVARTDDGPLHRVVNCR